MLLLYDLGTLFFYFLTMILFLGVAIIFGRKKSAWVWYAIGALLQLMSLSGNQKIANINGRDTSVEWVTYFLLLIISAIIICKRYQKAVQNNNLNINGEKQECVSKCETEDNGSQNGIYLICIFDATTHTLRKEKKNIDVAKFPPSKFADNDTYYAIETYRDEKKVRIYYTKENWDKQIEIGISEKEK